MRIVFVYSLRCAQMTLNKLLNNSGLTIYMTFICSHINYTDSVYHKSLFHEKLQLIQYNAALTILGTIRGSSKKF